VSRNVLGLLVVPTLVGCTTAAHANGVSAQSIALQPGDVSGLVKCARSGDIQTVITQERSNDQAAASQYAAEWEQWKTQGATEAYYAAYGQTSTDCDALSAIGTGAPTGGLIAGLVVTFKDQAIAARTYRADSTLLGFGPKDIAFIHLVGGSVMTGSSTGFGPESVVGSGYVSGATYYFAFWQKKVVDSFFIAYDMPSAVAEGAARRVNQRMNW
jgi:hypothetical protein